jgi:hypothetical protein
MRNRALNFLRARRNWQSRIVPLDEGLTVPSLETEINAELIALDHKANLLGGISSRLLSLLKAGCSLRESAGILGVSRREVSKIVSILKGGIIK